MKAVHAIYIGAAPRSLVRIPVDAEFLTLRSDWPQSLGAWYCCIADEFTHTQDQEFLMMRMGDPISDDERKKFSVYVGSCQTAEGMHVFTTADP